jgi:hypothetical protein
VNFSAFQCIEIPGDVCGVCVNAVLVLGHIYHCVPFAAAPIAVLVVGSCVVWIVSNLFSPGSPILRLLSIYFLLSLTLTYRLHSVNEYFGAQPDLAPSLCEEFKPQFFREENDEILKVSE